MKNDNSTGFHVGAPAGRGGNTHRSGPTILNLNAMSLQQFRTEINGHLSGDKNTISHFSSWTANLGTAVHYTWGRRASSVGLNRYIGILDTSRRHAGNVILHVRALRAEWHTSFKYDYEYLVFGPVKGVSYTCLKLPRPRSIPRSHLASHPPLYADWSRWPGSWIFYPLSSIRKAYNRAAHHLFYNASATGHKAYWGSCTNTALYLTLIAAEWSQYGSLYLVDTEDQRRSLISDLSQVMEWAARDTTLVLPLVNPLTDPAGSSQTSVMVRLLMHFETEIFKLRAKPPPESWSLTSFLWGQT